MNDILNIQLFHLGQSYLIFMYTITLKKQRQIYKTE